MIQLPHDSTLSSIDSLPERQENIGGLGARERVNAQCALVHKARDGVCHFCLDFIGQIRSCNCG